MARDPGGLRIPDRLAFSVLVSLAAGGCTHDSGADAADAAIEVVTDAMDVASEAGVDASDIAEIIANDAAGGDANDGAACDVQPYGPGSFQCMPARGSDGGSCASAFACSSAMCGAGCVGCAFDPTSFEYGFHCLADRDGGATDCPATVCTAGECPSGCHSCRSANFCIPDPSADVRVARCEPSSVCEGDTTCPMGCILVG